MKLAALVSGGKDSAYALYIAMQRGHDVTQLITIRSDNPESYMYHTRNVHLTSLFSEACRIPILVGNSKGEKEKEIEDLRRALQNADVEGVVAGAIESEYQKSRVEKVCSSLGLELITPLWKKNANEVMEEIIEKFDVLVTHVAAYGLDESWLGIKLDRKALEDLKNLKKKCGIHIAGEGGEYETFVLDAPFFVKKIEITKAEKKWYGDYGTFEILEARLVEKK